MSSAIRSQGNSVTSARQVLGDTSGTAVPAGMIGEMFTDTNTTTIGVNVATTVISRTLKPGVWVIYGKSDIDGNAAFTSFAASISTTTNSFDSIYIIRQSVNTVGWTGASLTRVVNISTDTTYYLVVYSDAANGARTQRNAMQCVRIA